MAKFSGKIGFVTSVSLKEGVAEDVVEERQYYGEVLRQSKNWVTGDKVNDDLTLNSRLSVISDDFACENFSSMKYAIINGIYWKVINVEVIRPRIILTLGGVYNGIKA